MTQPAPSSDRLERLRRLARAVPGGMAVGRWLHRLVNLDLRAIHRLIRAERDRLFQPFPDTAENRYPELFDALAVRLAHLPAPRILSFGCSSGAEVRALRLRLPSAQITGLDLNPRVLATARRADRHPASTYRHAAAPDSADRYDAILALAIFRHGALEAERPASCAAILRFAQVDRAITGLDACLVPGGWLAIHHSHFRFADTWAAAGYDADPLLLPGQQPAEPLYGPDNQRLAAPEVLPVLYCKQPR